MSEIGPQTELTYVLDRVLNPAIKWALQDEVKKVMLGTDTCKAIQDCCWKRHCPSVTLRRNDATKKASYFGLVSCKSTWICSICMTRIQAARSQEVRDGIDRWVSQNDGDVKMITFTFSHKRGDQLSVMLEQFGEAMRFFANSRQWQKVLRETGAPGRVTAQEYTYGPKTGHHPHRHALLFIKKGTWRVRHTTAIKRLWKRCAARAGLKASIEHGVDVCGGESAGGYLTKFAEELALNVGKLGRGVDRCSPMGLVVESMDGNKWARGVFREYAAAYKGKRQLIWSKGLKELLQIKDVSDVEILEAGERYENWGLLDPNGWDGILLKKLRAELAECVGATGRIEIVRQLLSSNGIDPNTLTPILEGKPTCLKRRKPKTESNHEPVSAPGVVENSN